LLSFFIRSALAVAGFYLLLAIRWEMMAIGLAGFVVIRYLLIRSWGTIPVKLRESWGDEDGI